MKVNNKTLAIGTVANLLILTMYFYLEQFVHFLPVYDYSKSLIVPIAEADWYAIPLVASWLTLQVVASIITINVSFTNE